MDANGGIDNSGPFSTASSIFSYLGRDLNSLKLESSSTSAFSVCNSDHSGEFSHDPGSRSLLIAACSNHDDELLKHLVTDLESKSPEIQRRAVMEIRLLAKEKTENRIRIADAGAIWPLVRLAQSTDAQIQEISVTALLNLSLYDKNKDRLVSSGAIRALIHALKAGTMTAKENSACAILRLASQDDVKASFGRVGAIPPLVRLLKSGTLRGKKDAAGALFALTMVRDNKVRAIEAGVMGTLVGLMADFESEMVDKAALVTLNLVSASEAQSALVEEGGIPVVAGALETGTPRQKELAVGILLELCEQSMPNRIMVAREGAIPPLIALTQSGTTKAKQKAETLIRQLRQASEYRIAQMNV